MLRILKFQETLSYYYTKYIFRWYEDPLLVIGDGRGMFELSSCYNMVSRGSRFLSYNFLQCAIDGKNNSKTKVEKAFFFIFMSSYAEMSF
jgi:hypothetical protein